MPTFQYQALKSDGESVNGFVFGTSLDTATHHTSKVNAQERKIRIWYWINEVFYQIVFFWADFVILTTEWNNTDIDGIVLGHLSYLVRI